MKLHEDNILHRFSLWFNDFKFFLLNRKKNIDHEKLKLLKESLLTD